ncbi:MAG: hypothetical protein RL186_1833 [Pseudomonadota bacterium]
MASETELEVAIAAMMAQAGFAGAQRVPLAQDASTRSYERLQLGDARAILMKAPPSNEGDNPPCPPDADEATRKALGWNALSRLAASRVEAFVAIGDFLRANGFSAPRILSVDAQAGVAVLEDLGQALYADVIASGDAPDVPLYQAAGKTLAALHALPVPGTLPAPIGHWPILDFDAIALRENANLFIDWTPAFLGRPALSPQALADWAAIREDLIADILTHTRAFTLRDYHAENILWLPERSGIARVGLLDFQDGVHGYAAWDFAMLLHDARRDVSPQAHQAAVRAYLDQTGASDATFAHELAVQGAVNALRILGIFARLITRDGKARYRDFVPREANHLAVLLEHPRLKDLKRWIDRHAPLPAFMERN